MRCRSYTKVCSRPPYPCKQQNLTHSDAPTIKKKSASSRFIFLWEWYIPRVFAYYRNLGLADCGIVGTDNRSATDKNLEGIAALLKRCVKTHNLRRCFRTSPSVMDFSKLPSGSSSAPSILHIYTHLKRVMQNLTFVHTLLVDNRPRGRGRTYWDAPVRGCRRSRRTTGRGKLRRRWECRRGLPLSPS